MVKLGPDVENNNADAYSGFLPTGQIYGFSMMHESGTGGAPKYGVVSQMPVVGNIPNPLVDLGQNRSTNDTAQVGYLKSSLANGVIVEVAGTEHAGFYQYTFPSCGSESSVVVDISHVLPSYRGLGWGQGYAGGSFNVHDNGYSGHGVYNNGWNLAPNWTIYFCGHFDQSAVANHTFTGNGTELYSYGNASSTNGSYRQGGVFTFKQTKVTSRVGISFLSSQQACQNVDSEIPEDTSLGDLVDAAQTRWNEQVFSRVRSSETNSTILTQLYTYLYGMMVCQHHTKCS